MIGLAYRAAYYVRFQLSLSLFHLEVNPSVAYYRGLVLIILPAWLLLFAFRGLYNLHNLLGGTVEYSLLFNATTLGMVGVIGIGFLLQDIIFARAWLLLAWAFSFLFTGAARFGIRRIIYFLRKKGYFLTPAVIIGANEESKILAEQLLQWRASGLFILGFIDDHVEPGETLFHNLKALGKVADLENIIKQYRVKEVILTTSALTRDKMVKLFKKYGLSNQVNLRLSSGLFEIITTGLQVNEVASVPLIRVNHARLTGIDHYFKLIVDYVITIPGLILISPFMFLLALVVKLDSNGPVIYRRRVMGVNGLEFNAYKFRTMRVDGDEILKQHPELQEELKENYKLIEDPRITRTGKFLRRTSLDELPQLFNVLKREMSLVGPRMISPEEVKMYNQWDLNLLTVPPGITGLWQVSGRSDLSYEDRVRLDMYYIRNWSIWMDLQILLQTIPAVIRGRGAY
jgi:exopolysaccharide biosynthesis polyprenyl glycosylphosphotransferase